MSSVKIKSLPLAVIYAIIFSICLHFNDALAAIINVASVECETIQTGIDASVDGNTVLAADGTYTGDSNRNFDFKGIADERRGK